MSDLFLLYDYYVRMESYYFNSDWEDLHGSQIYRDDYYLYRQFRLLARNLRREIEKLI